MTSYSEHAAIIINNAMKTIDRNNAMKTIDINNTPRLLI